MSLLDLYVAGASKELKRCQNFILGVRYIGHRITFDWTKAVAEFGATPLSDDLCKTAAMIDLEGVRHSNMVILLAPGPENHSTGCWTEIGGGLILGIPLIVSGDAKRSIFTRRAAFTFQNDEETLGYLRTIAAMP